MRNFLEQRVKPVQYFRPYSDLALLSALRDIFTETALTRMSSNTSSNPWSRSDRAPSPPQGERAGVGAFFPCLMVLNSLLRLFCAVRSHLLPNPGMKDPRPSRANEFHMVKSRSCSTALGSRG